MTAKIFSILKDYNYETFTLVWLDSQANNSPEYIKKLRTVINYLKTFETIDLCEQYIQSVSNYDRIILIVSDKFAEEILLRIHSFRQISSIYIYGKTNKITDQWITQYSKIRCVALELDALVTEIQSEQTNIDELFSISIYKTNLPENSSNQQFIYFELLIDCLLRLEINLSDRTEFLSLCREIYKDNPNQLDLIDEFEQNYSSNQAVEWYKRNIFLSKILHKALYTQNIELLFLFRFFLRDIQQQLKQNQYSSSIRLYRSQLISNEELQLLKHSIGEFISINVFLTTKFHRQLTISDFDGFISSDNLQRVVFEIDADPQLDNIKPFAAMDSSEIVMMAGSIFRVIDIHLDDDQLWIIRMELCSTNEETFKITFDYSKRKIGYNDKHVNISTIGNILWKMDKLDQAERYYLYVIDLLPGDYSDLADLYYNLGHVYSDKNDYDLSLKYYKKSLELWMKTGNTNDSDLANNYNAIATNYWKKGDHPRAFESFNKSLELFKKVYNGDHISIAMCLNNMGTVISHEKNNYSKALNYYLKALVLFQKHLAINHPNLGSLHCNIGTIYKHLDQTDLALEQFNLSLNIYEKIFPSNHPNIIMMLKNISFLHEKKEDNQQALESYEKISNIYRRSLTSTDPIVLQLQEKIEDLKRSMN